MGDIVERLRDYSKVANAIGGYPADDPTLASQAADEIERLRKALREAGNRAADWVNGDATPPDIGIYEYVICPKP